MTQRQPGVALLIRDRRDAQHPMRAAAAAPGRIVYPTGPIIDQKDTPLCVGCAWRSWLSAPPIAITSGPSDREIYTNARRIGNTPADVVGASTRDAAKYLQRLGLMGEYVWARTTDQIRTWLLADKGTVVLTCHFYVGMEIPAAKDAMISATGPIHPIDHAFVISGVDDTTDTFRFTNSWGPTWGQNGSAWISRQGLQTILGAGGLAVSATEIQPKGAS